MPLRRLLGGQRHRVPRVRLGGFWLRTAAVCPHVPGRLESAGTHALLLVGARGPAGEQGRVGEQGGARKGLQDHQGREQDNGTTTHPLRTLVALARQLHQCYALALAQSKYTHYYPYRTNTRKPLS